jgi:hypothetical protein
MVFEPLLSGSCEALPAGLADGFASALVLVVRGDIADGLNRPGFLGGSGPWKRGWSMAGTGARRRPQKYPDELRERAVRMVLEIREQTGERHGAVTRVARELGIGAES